MAMKIAPVLWMGRGGATCACPSRVPRPPHVTLRNDAFTDLLDRSQSVCMFGTARTDRSVFASEQTPRLAVTFYYCPPLSRAVFIPPICCAARAGGANLH